MIAPMNDIPDNQRTAISGLCGITRALLDGGIRTVPAGENRSTSADGVTQLDMLTNWVMIGVEAYAQVYRYRGGKSIIHLVHSKIDPLFGGSMIVVDHGFEVPGSYKSPQYIAYNPQSFPRFEKEMVRVDIDDPALVAAVAALAEALVPFDPSLPDETLASLADDTNQNK